MLPYYISSDSPGARPRLQTNMERVSDQLGVARAGAYSLRAPSPPRVIVPGVVSEIQRPLPRYSDFQCNSQDRDLIVKLTQGRDIEVKHAGWSYELRRSFQAVLSYLYLGPSGSARDIEALKREGITMLLAIRDSMQIGIMSGDKVARQLGIEAKAIDISGSPKFVKSLHVAVSAINDHLISYHRQRTSEGIHPDDPQAAGKVLVFCESGNERSATVVTAYLMTMYNLSIVDAIQYAQSARFCCALDDELKNMLVVYEQILLAQKQVSTAVGELQNERPTIQKRCRADVDEEMDMNYQQVDDHERFIARTAQTPFFDQTL